MYVNSLTLGHCSICRRNNYVNRLEYKNQPVKSIKLAHSFIVDQLEGGKLYTQVNIMSLRENKLLVGCRLWGEYQTLLFIYSSDGHYLSNISDIPFHYVVDKNETYLLWDAQWTPSGNIIVALELKTFLKSKVMVFTETGNFISSTQFILVNRLSVSSDNSIYLCDNVTRVYQSTDDGISWSIVFNSTDVDGGWLCTGTIKVPNKSSDDFWTLEFYADREQAARLQVYSVDKSSFAEEVGGLSAGNLMSRKHTSQRLGLKHVKHNMTQCNIGAALRLGSLSDDGNMNIFLDDYFNKTVHVLTAADGVLHCHFLSTKYVRQGVTSHLVDRERQLLYVGQDDRIVTVFKLFY